MIVQISEKSARLTFHDCTIGYILNVCQGRCCYCGSGKNKHTTVYAEPFQRDAIIKAGGKFTDMGVLETTKDGTCPFHSPIGICELHQKGLKPRSCSISPWKLTKLNKITLRYRYPALRCYKHLPQKPAYKVFKAGLITMFGQELADKIEEHFDNNKGNFLVNMPDDIYRLMSGVNTHWSTKEIKCK